MSRIWQVQLRIRCAHWADCYALSFYYFFSTMSGSWGKHRGTVCSHWADSYALCLEHFFITISGNLGWAYGADARLNTSIIVRRLIHAVPLKLLPHTGTCSTVTGSRIIHAVPLNVLLHNGMCGISDV